MNSLTTKQCWFCESQGRRGEASLQEYLLHDYAEDDDLDPQQMLKCDNCGLETLPFEDTMDGLRACLTSWNVMQLEGRKQQRIGIMEGKSAQVKELI